MPVRSPCPPCWHQHRAAVNQQSGPGDLTDITGPKQMWDRVYPGSAARAALGLKGARRIKPCTYQPRPGCKTGRSRVLRYSSLGIASGRPCARRWCCRVLEIERRPRGASRARARRPPRSHICFGPVMPVASPCPPCWHQHRAAVNLQSGPGDATGITGPKQTLEQSLLANAPRGRRSVSRALEESSHAPISPDPGVRQAHRRFFDIPRWGLHRGLQVPGDGVVAFLRSSAARAALREQGLGAPLAPTSVSGQLCL